MFNIKYLIYFGLTDIKDSGCEADFTTKTAL